ncbi:MAG: hypothetical protein KDK62_07520 [Chlamydiia bacterium]|nr:hypothetical protein [Chlamydiia bacterium]
MKVILKKNINLESSMKESTNFVKSNSFDKNKTDKIPNDQEMTVYGVLVSNNKLYYLVCHSSNICDMLYYPALYFKVTDPTLSSYWQLLSEHLPSGTLQHSLVNIDWANTPEYLERFYDGDPDILISMTKYRRLMDIESNVKYFKHSNKHCDEDIGIELKKLLQNKPSERSLIEWAYQTYTNQNVELSETGRALVKSIALMDVFKTQDLDIWSIVNKLLKRSYKKEDDTENLLKNVKSITGAFEGDIPKDEHQIILDFIEQKQLKLSLETLVLSIKNSQKAILPSLKDNLLQLLHLAKADPQVTKESVLIKVKTLKNQ